MTYEFFRTALLVVVALFIPFALYYRIRSNSGEKLDRWQEGTLILFGLRLSGLPWFVGSTTWCIAIEWMAWASLSLPVWLRCAGLGLVFLAGLLI